MKSKKKKVKAKPKAPRKKKRKPSPKNGRKPGRQPLELGQKTIKFTLRIPESEENPLIKRADALVGRRGEGSRPNVSGYLRELVRRDIAQSKAS